MSVTKTTVNGVQHQDEIIKYPTIKELKNKYESYTKVAAEVPRITSHFTARKLYKKSKVKQIASMFNTKLSQNGEGVGDEVKGAAKLETMPSLPPISHSTKSNSEKQKTLMTSPRTKSKFKFQQNCNTVFQCEDESTKLTVKHKVKLYDQFINEIYKNKPKLIEHAELMVDTVKNAEARGEVVNEKQASVKYLLEKLEAHSDLPRQTVSTLALQRFASNKSDAEKITAKSKLPSKDEELKDPVNHISTITVKLQPSSTPKISRQTESRSLPSYKTGTKCDLKPKVETEVSSKRNNEQMRYSFPFEVFAPPRKIRRTRTERLAPTKLQNLFFDWLSERDKNNGYKVEQAGIIANPFIEETKLDNRDNNINKEHEKETTESKSREPKPMQCKQKPVPPEPLNIISNSLTSDTTQANDDSESGLSLLQKITSDESQADKPEVKSDKDFELVKPTRTARKKKLRRTLTWPANEPSESTTSTNNSIGSDTEIKLAETKTNGILMQPLRNQNNVKEFPNQPSSEELDSDFLREVNSPRKIKSAYTLTIYTPSPTQEEEGQEKNINHIKEGPSQTWCTVTDNSLSSSSEEKDNIKYLEQKTSQACSTTAENSYSTFQEDNDKTPPLKRETLQTENSSPSPKVKDKIKNLNEGTAQTSFSAIKNSTQQEPASLNKVSFLDATDNASNICDSFIDQGFETGSNDTDSPVRNPKSCTFNKKDTGQFYSFLQQLTAKPSPSAKARNQNNSRFSIPTTEGQLPIRVSNSLLHQQLCSSRTKPLKNRRRSLYDKESRHSSLPMQVIREDQPLEPYKVTPCSTNNKEQKPSTNAPALDRPIDVTGMRTEKTSQFWIKCSCFSLAFDIFYNDSNQLSMLYDIFSQRSYEYKNLYFGIDNLIFSVSRSDKKQSVPKRLTLQKQYSQYWVATGDCVIPFAGKRLSADKIQHIFQFLKIYVADSGVTRFGIDGIEFSKVSEFWDICPKFSMESNYSVLVGLQSGNSNGLEGRSKYAWPHTKPVRVSDMDRASNKINNLEEHNSSRSSISPFSDIQHGVAASSPTEPHPHPSLRSSELFGLGYKNESLEYLFNEPQPVAAPAAAAAAVFNQIKAEQERLSLTKDKHASYNNRAHIYYEILDALRGTPQYLQYLKSIVKKIINKERRHDFKTSTFEELESYLFFLSRYADICMRNCNNHIDKLLDTLLDHRAVAV